jgi:hypothetical protein
VPLHLSPGPPCPDPLIPAGPPSPYSPSTSLLPSPRGGPRISRILFITFPPVSSHPQCGWESPRGRSRGRRCGSSPSPRAEAMRWEEHRRDWRGSSRTRPRRSSFCSLIFKEQPCRIEDFDSAQILIGFLVMYRIDWGTGLPGSVGTKRNRSKRTKRFMSNRFS